jgi:hypothetical protein
VPHHTTRLLRHARHAKTPMPLLITPHTPRAHTRAARHTASPAHAPPPPPGACWAGTSTATSSPRTSCWGRPTARARAACTSWTWAWVSQLPTSCPPPRAAAAARSQPTDRPGARFRPCPSCSSCARA